MCTQLELRFKIYELEKEINLLQNQLEEYKLQLKEPIIADWEKDLYDWA